MALVDTSGWIRSPTKRAPSTVEIYRFLSLDEFVRHELPYGELPIGNTGGRRRPLAAYERIHPAKLIPHHDVVAFVQARDLRRRGVVGIDVHLSASAAVGRMRLWAGDSRFAAVAAELGVAHEVSAQ